MNKKQTMSYVMLISLVLLCGCKTTITPTCHFINFQRQEELSQIRMSVVVKEGRPDSKRYFFHNNIDKAWEENAKNYWWSKNELVLSAPSYTIIQESLSDALTQIGYNITGHSTVALNCEVRKFLHELPFTEQWIYSKIELDISVKQGDKVILQKNISNIVQKPINIFRQMQDSEPGLSECLTGIVRKIVYDQDIENALRSAYGLPPKVQPKPTPSPKTQPTPEPALTPKSSSGTGFAVCENGYIVTAYHVVEGADSIQIKFPGGKWIPAQVIKKSQTNDIAILKTNTMLSNVLVLTDDMKLGQKIFTIGYPVTDLLGVEPKYTDGSISSLTGLSDEAAFMQISVPTQPGNSGGPLMNEKGQVVGMITSGAAIEYFYNRTGTLPENINWAIKSPFIKPLIPQECPNQGGSKEIDAVERAKNSVCLIKAETY